jgi:hypothetical protein
MEIALAGRIAHVDSDHDFIGGAAGDGHAPRVRIRWAA